MQFWKDFKHNFLTFTNVCYNAEIWSQPEPNHDNDEDNESKSTESLPSPIGEKCHGHRSDQITFT